MSLEVNPKSFSDTPSHPVVIQVIRSLALREHMGTSKPEHHRIFPWNNGLSWKKTSLPILNHETYDSHEISVSIGLNQSIESWLRLETYGWRLEKSRIGNFPNLFIKMSSSLDHAVPTKGTVFLGFGGVALGISIMILCKSTMVNDDGYYMVNIWLMMVNNISGWWLTYPSEKWWSESQLGRMTSHIFWEKKRFKTTSQKWSKIGIYPFNMVKNRTLTPLPKFHGGFSTRYPKNIKVIRSWLSIETQIRASPLFETPRQIWFRMILSTKERTVDPLNVSLLKVADVTHFWTSYTFKVGLLFGSFLQVFSELSQTSPYFVISLPIFQMCLVDYCILFVICSSCWSRSNSQLTASPVWWLTSRLPSPFQAFQAFQASKTMCRQRICEGIRQLQKACVITGTLGDQTTGTPMTDPNGAAIYGVPWIPSRYPLYVSIYTSTMDPSWV